MCKKVFRLVVAGSRDFTNFKEAERILCSVLRNKKPDEVCIISGGAKGADRIGELFANKYNCKLQIYSANWDRDGKRAGMIRNKRMAVESDATILFWDGVSSGSRSMHVETLVENNPLYVVYYDPITQEIVRMEDESNPF